MKNFDFTGGYIADQFMSSGSPERSLQFDRFRCRREIVCAALEKLDQSGLYMTDEELAGLVGVSKSTIARYRAAWLRGRTA